MNPNSPEENQPTNSDIPSPIPSVQPPTPVSFNTGSLVTTESKRYSSKKLAFIGIASVIILIGIMLVLIAIVKVK